MSFMRIVRLLTVVASALATVLAARPHAGQPAGRMPFEIAGIRVLPSQRLDVDLSVAAGAGLNP